MTNSDFIERELYKGTVKVKFFPQSHVYMVNGKRASSPTGAIGIIDKSRVLMGWQKGEIQDCLMLSIGKPVTVEMIDFAIEAADRKKEGAADIGTEAHNWMEDFVKGKNPAMPKLKGAKQAVMSFLDWMDQHKVKFTHSEKLVYSKKYNYVGTCDAIAKVGNEKLPYIIDYKVSNGLYPGVALQTAAYQNAETEESGQQYAGRWALRFAKETEEEYMVTQEKKLKKYLKNNPGKGPYEIPEYKAFEFRLLTDYERDLDCFTTALALKTKYDPIDKEFFNYGK